MELKNLRTLRKNKGLTLDKLAKIVPGVSNQTISNWETGKTEPDIQALKVLSSYFSVSIDFLVNNTKSMETSRNELKTKLTTFSKNEIVELLKKQIDLLFLIDGDRNEDK